MKIHVVDDFLRLAIGTLLFATLGLVPNPSVAADKEWLHYGGNQWNERHAELKQITKENVAQFTPRRVLQIPTPMNGLVESPAPKAVRSR